MNRSNAAAFVWGIITAFALQMLTAEIVWQATGHEQCPYKFPWSGQCSRRNHHLGSHY